MGELLPQQFAIPRCFCCGPDNPTGLKLRFVKESDTSVSTTFTGPLAAAATAAAALWSAPPTRRPSKPADLTPLS